MTSKNPLDNISPDILKGWAERTTPQWLNRCWELYAKRDMHLDPAKSIMVLDAIIQWSMLANTESIVATPKELAAFARPKPTGHKCVICKKRAEHGWFVFDPHGTERFECEACRPSTCN